MKVFAISDLHLSTVVEKPMDIFGDDWQNHFDKISKDWKDKVSEGDLVLLGGDLSWGISIDEAAPDLTLIDELPGKKIIVKGNHDYYWQSLNKMRAAFPNFDFIQNNSIRFESNGKGIVIAGSRGWNIATDASADEDKKIYARELMRIEMSLKSAQGKRKDGDILIALMHYPPFEAEYKSTEMTDILEKYNVDFVLYGHLHGKGARVTPTLVKNNIQYILTSCDLVDNKLIEICEL